MGAATKTVDPARAGPVLRLERYFEGATRGWGVFEDRFGKLRRRFTVQSTGRWIDGALDLAEQFQFDDGRESRKRWRIVPVGETGYRGTADGVSGTAIGTVQGNSLRWAYIYDLEIGARTWRVRFEDRYYLQEDGILINRSLVRKFGMLIGEATLVFEKRAHAGGAPSEVPKPPR